jgi:hypothetical protein
MEIEVLTQSGDIILQQKFARDDMMHEIRDAVAAALGTRPYLVDLTNDAIDLDPAVTLHDALGEVQLASILATVFPATFWMGCRCKCGFCQASWVSYGIAT